MKRVLIFFCSRSRSCIFFGVTLDAAVRLSFRQIQATEKKDFLKKKLKYIGFSIHLLSTRLYTFWVTCVELSQDTNLFLREIGLHGVINNATKCFRLIWFTYVLVIVSEPSLYAALGTEPMERIYWLNANKPVIYHSKISKTTTKF